MAYTSPKTWQYKETLSASDLNTYLKDNVLYLKGQVDLLLDNYVLAVSVASNDLIVAVKHISGVDPSADLPVHFKVGGAIYTLTQALSITIPDGTDWFRLGSQAETLAQEQDLFAYIIYETTSGHEGLKIGVARHCHGSSMNDFSNTNNEEDYIKWSGNTNNSTDKVRVIGRFNAQLSATPFNWSIPSPAVVLSYPIFTTRFLPFAPQLAGTGSMTVSSITTVRARFKIVPHACLLNTYQTFTIGGSVTNEITFTIPYKTTSTDNAAMFCVLVPGGTQVVGEGYWNTNRRLFIRDYGANNFTATAGKSLRVNGFYPI